MKKIVCVVLSVLLILCSAPIAYAEEPTHSSIVSAKQAMARAHADEYISDYTLTEEYELREQLIDEITQSMYIGTMDKAKGESLLEKIGVYKLEVPKDPGDLTTTATPQPSDVDLQNVEMYYDGPTGQWRLCASGKWRNNHYVDTINYAGFLKLGLEVEVGGYDGAGIILYNTSGTYNTRMISSKLYYTGGEYGHYVYTPSTLDGSKGAFFLFQDSVKIVELDSSHCSWDYVGRAFLVTLVYDRNFSNYDGYARLQYTHTWDTAAITGTTIGVSQDGFNFDVKIENASNSFTCYSSGETKF